MQKIKELLCNIFGHKWEKKSQSDMTYNKRFINEEWVCSRCGTHTTIVRK
jgi:hypothetical protein